MINAQQFIQGCGQKVKERVFAMIAEQADISDIDRMMITFEDITNTGKENVVSVYSSPSLDDLIGIAELNFNEEGLQINYIKYTPIFKK